MPTVLLSAPPNAPADDLRELLAGAGFAVAGHALGSVPPVDFGSVAAAVVAVGDRPEAAAAQTRRWRVELGDQFVPVLWVLPEPSAERAALGLEAGADAVLARPVEPAVFAAQVRAMARARDAAERVRVRAAEARLLGDQLRKAHAQLDATAEVAGRVGRAFQPRSLPEVGPVRFAVFHRSRGKAGGEFHDVRRLDEDHVGFVLGSVIGQNPLAAGLLAVFARQAVTWKEITESGYRLVPPEEVLAGVNRDLLGFGLEDPPLVAMLAGVVNVRDGSLSLARAGLPPPVFVPAEGEPEAWAVPGPFLGTADTSFQPLARRLKPGDQLLLAGESTRPEGEPTADWLLGPAARHRELSGQAFADAVGRELLPQARPGEDFTLLVVGTNPR